MLFASIWDSYSANILQHWVGASGQIYFCKVDHSNIFINFSRNWLGLNNLCEILQLEMGLGAQPRQEHFAFYTLICVWKQYFQHLNWHKIVTYIKMLTFFLNTADLIINNWLLLYDTTFCTETPCSPFDKIWKQGEKNHNF